MKYRFADILLDTTSHSVMRNDKLLHLTNIEFRLLEYLAQHTNKVCTRDEILNHVWGLSLQYDTGTVEVHLHSLRRKLGFTNTYPIESIRSVGIILHTGHKRQLHSLNIQEFAIQWITEHEADFFAKQLTPRYI